MLREGDPVIISGKLAKQHQELQQDNRTLRATAQASYAFKIRVCVRFLIFKGSGSRK
jgi:hypothetical protein